MGTLKITVILLMMAFGAAFAQADKGAVAPELVGQWCYVNLGAENEAQLTSSCVTLRDDGSYEIQIDNKVARQTGALQNSDFGTWSVKDNVLYYHSSAMGDGSFRIQKINYPSRDNAPAIVLNGIPFFSSTPKDPW